MILEKNVPPPLPRTKTGIGHPENPYVMPRKWPWPDMEVGDSLVVNSRGEARSAHNSFMCHKRTKHSRLKPSWYVIMRQQPDGTYRLWLLDRDAP
jgi:hypothetical protein